MTKRLSLLGFALLSLQAVAQPVTYYCTLLTQLPGAPVSPVFRFEVDGIRATLTYSYQARATEPSRDFKIPLDVLNDSGRSLVLGALTEGDQIHAPRYDVWVLDKNNMQLSSEATRADDANIRRVEQRSGTCIIEH